MLKYVRDYAISKGKEGAYKARDLREHQERNQSRKTPKASSSDRVQSSGQVKEEEKEVSECRANPRVEADVEAPKYTKKHKSKIKPVVKRKSTHAPETQGSSLDLSQSL